MKKNTSSFIQKVTLLAGSVLLLGTFFSACQTEEPQAQKVNVEQIIITDVDGESTETSVEQGDFIGLSATVLPENATDKTIVWESSDETIATVSEEGVVTAVEPEEDEEETAAEKTVTITATAQDGSEVYGEIEVKILPKTIHVESITIASQYDNSILKDEDTALTITVLPENAAVKTYKIKSSDESVLKITETDGVYSAVGVAQGTAKILVVADDRYQNTHKSAEYEIEVLGQKVDIESVALSAANTVIEDGNVVFTGSTSALSLTKTPANATLSRTNGTVWSITEGGDLATLDENGNITFGNKAGSVTVKVVATDRSDKKAEATLTYEVRKPVTAVAITTPEAAALDEETVLLAREDDKETEADDRVITLGATVTPEDATIKTLTWTSSDESIATVDQQTGKVTALKAGEATITAIATDGSTKSASKTVRVFIPVTKIELSAANTTGDSLSTIALDLAVTPSDADSSVTYEVTEGTASVDTNGVVTLGDIAEEVTVVATSKTNSKKTSTITLTSVLNKTRLQAAITSAAEKLETVGDNTTEDVTDVGKYLTARKTAVENTKSAAETQNTSGTKQSEIDKATADLLEAIAACVPLAITPAKDTITIDEEGFVYVASASATDVTKISNGLAGGGSIAPSETDVYENYETTEANVFVKHVKVDSAFAVTVTEKSAAPKTGFNNKVHVSLFTSKKVSIGLAIWAPHEITGVGVAIPTVTFDPATGKVTSELRRNNGTLIGETEGFESRVVGSGTVGSDNWWSVDFAWTNLYEKQSMTGNLYGLVFFPQGEESSEYFFDNLYIYKEVKSEAELIEDNKIELNKVIATATELYNKINGNESDDIFDYGKYRTGTAATLQSEISLAQTEYASVESTIDSLVAAKAKLEGAIETAKGGEIIEDFDPPVALPATASLFTIYTSDPNVTGGETTNLSNTNGDAQNFNLGKIEYTDYPVDGRIVKKVSLTESSPLKFSNEWRNVGRDIAQENYIFLNLSLYTRHDVEFKVAVYGDKHYDYKVDVENLKVTSEEVEVGTVVRDENNWLNVKIDVTGYREKHGSMFSIAFITDSNQYFYFDNFFFYEQEPSGEALVNARQAKLAAALDEAAAVLNAAKPGSTPGRYPQTAIDTFRTVYDSALAVKDSNDAAVLGNAITSLESALASFEASCIAVSFTIAKDELTEDSFASSLTTSLETSAFTSSSGNATLAFDRQLGSRWESAQTDNEWLAIDFGDAVTFNTIRFKWEGAYTKKYQIQISEDGTAWDTIIEVKDGTGGNETINMNTAVTAQYVRFHTLERGTQWGNSFYEMGITNE